MNEKELIEKLTQIGKATLRFTPPPDATIYFKEPEASRELDALIAVKIMGIRSYLIHTDDNGKYVDMPEGARERNARWLYWNK